eukprot:9588479-Karenia_brevis.AAC.1
MTFDDLNGARLREVLIRMRVGQACGMEGWRVEELKKLPDMLLHRLAILLNAVEKTGSWPLSLQRALVSFVPKGSKNDPKDLRPIS